MDEPRELARDVAAHQRLVAADGAIGDEYDGKLVALALGLQHDEVDGRVVPRHIEALPRDPLRLEQLLDAHQLPHVPVLLEVDEHRSRVALDAAALAAPGAQVGQTRSRPLALCQLLRAGERAAECDVEALPEILGNAHGGERVAAGSADDAVEDGAHEAEHGGVGRLALPPPRRYALPRLMYGRAREHYAGILDGIRDAGLEKRERLLTGPQGATITVRESASPVLNFCANNYLGLSSHPRVLEAAHRALDEYGFGLASVRFICGTQDAHKRLEAKISDFLGTEDAILYSSCFDANGGLFETLLGEEDAILSDAYNHASIIDGIRLCKAERHRYPHGDMAALEEALKRTQDRRVRMIATDGVFSMEGDVAPLEAICDLGDRYQALVMVDDSHATGFVGPTGRGSLEQAGVVGRVDVVTSTLGKALGGAAGGFTTGRREIIDLLRQRSRPYLFSNTVAPSVVGASLAVLELLTSTTQLRDRLMNNARRFREGMTKAGFRIKPGTHPIVPIMMSGPRAVDGGDARLAQEIAAALLDEGIYVIGFSYPVVAKGESRIRVQLSAAHTPEMVDRAVEAFTRVGRRVSLV